MSKTNDDSLRSRTDARTERKTEEARLARLAKALVDMSPKQRLRLDLPDGLADALDEASRMPNARALARQLRVVRRELRDGDVEAVESDVHRLLNPRPRATDTPPSSSPSSKDPIEVWVDQLVDDESIEAFMAEHPHADRQRLRTLLRNHSKAPPKAAKRARLALDAALREAMNQG